MTLNLISQTYRKDLGPIEPKYMPIFALEPPLILSKSSNFVAGQPFEAFKTMREHAPVMWHPAEKFEGFWALTTYADIRAVNLDTQRFSSQEGGILMAYINEANNHPQLFSAALNTMICLDPPHHMQLRREHMAYFTPGYVRTLKEKVDIEVARLLDNCEAQDSDFDLVDIFSAKLPLFTLCEILGIPEADRPKIEHWMTLLEMAQNTVERGELGTIDPVQIMTFLTEVQALFDYGRDILKDRRKTPREDLLSAIANVEIDGALLPDEFLDGSWLLIVFAGNDTTRNSISGTMKLLTQYKAQKAELIANPKLIPNMVHESIRMVSPVMYMRRTTTQDCEIGGQNIAKGEKVLMYYGAANRDPSVFENPDQFDIHRQNAKDHLAFGIGPHVCLGQRVANMQLESAYRQIFARIPTLEWTGEEEIAPNSFTHSITKLRVTR